MIDKAQALDEFGRAFTEQARDETVLWLHKVAEGTVTGSLMELHHGLARLNEEQREVALHLTRRFIDRALHNVLWMLEDTERFEIIVRLENGQSVSVSKVSDGLAGEIYTEDGWFARFSQYGEVAL